MQRVKDTLATFVLIIITILGWAYTAGNTSGKVADLDKRMDRIEMKMDALLVSHNGR